MTPQEKELQDYIEDLDGTAWKGLARAQYEKSTQQEGKTHLEAMIDVFSLIIDVSTKKIEGVKGPG